MRLLILPLLVAISQAAPLEITGVTEPFSIVFDDHDTLYGVEYENGNRVFRVKNGKLDFIAGQQTPGGKELGDVAGGDGGPAGKGRFNGMHDLALHPDGRLFIADTFNRRIRIIDLKSNQLSTLGNGKLRLKSPYTVALHPGGKRLLVADLASYRVFEIDLERPALKPVAGNGKKGVPKEGRSATGSPLLAPRAAIYGADGTIFIASREGHALRHVDRLGKIHTVVNQTGKKGYSGDGGQGKKARLNGPKHLALDPEGNIVVSDDNNHCLRLYDVTDGTIHHLAGTPTKLGKTLENLPAGTAINRPHGARYDGKGGLWIVDSFNHRLLCFPCD